MTNGSKRGASMRSESRDDLRNENGSDGDVVVARCYGVRLEMRRGEQGFFTTVLMIFYA